MSTPALRVGHWPPQAGAESGKRRTVGRGRVPKGPATLQGARLRPAALPTAGSASPPHAVRGSVPWGLHAAPRPGQVAGHPLQRPPWWLPGSPHHSRPGRAASPWVSPMPPTPHTARASGLWPGLPAALVLSPRAALPASLPDSAARRGRAAVEPCAVRSPVASVLPGGAASATGLATLTPRLPGLSPSTPPAPPARAHCASRTSEPGTGARTRAGRLSREGAGATVGSATCRCPA